MLAKAWSNVKKSLWFWAIWLLEETGKHRFFEWLNREVDRGGGVILQHLQSAVSWTIVHPIETFLLFAVTYCLGVIVLAQISIVRQNNTKALGREERKVSSGRIGEITFEYLPASPFENGWKEVDNVENITPSFSKEPGGRFSIHATPKYAIEYAFEPHETGCNRLQLSARFSNGSVIYAKVGMASGDGKIRKYGWIAHRFRVDAPPEKPFANEWIIFVSGRTEEGWLQLDLVLPDEVGRTFGKDGLVFKELVALRLRGSIAVSPIQLYRDDE